MVGVIAIAIALGGVFSFMLGRGHWSPRRARTEVRSATGSNFASVLAIVGIVEISLKLGETVPLGRAGLVLAVIAIALLVGIVAFGEAGRVVVAILGIALTVIALGPGQAIQVVIVVSLLLWLFGVLRGFTRSR